MYFMNASTRGISTLNSSASPFHLQAKTGTAAQAHQAANPAAIPAKDSVTFSGVANHTGNHTMELSNISDNSFLKAPFTLDVAESSKIGGILAGQDAWLSDVTVNGNVTAENGEIESVKSDVNGTLQAAKDIKVSQSSNIHGIHAGGFVDTDDVLVKGDVVSENGDIKLINSDVKGQLKALNGEVEVDDSDEIGGIQAASHVYLNDAQNVKGPIIAGGDVTLAGNTTVHDIVIPHSQNGETPSVHVGKGATVKGNIKFEDGNGKVFVEKGANLQGKTIGGQQVEVEQLEKRDTNFCDPFKTDFSHDGDKDCDPTINLQHNPFNLSQQQLNNANPCSAAGANKPPTKTALGIAMLLGSSFLLPNLLGRR